MELKDIISKRHMVRHFTDEPVASAVVQRILKLARDAPSTGFTQEQSFVVVTRWELGSATHPIHRKVSQGSHSSTEESISLLLLYHFVTLL